jgi:hypothetical protein
MTGVGPLRDACPLAPTHMPLVVLTFYPAVGGDKGDGIKGTDGSTPEANARIVWLSDDSLTITPTTVFAGYLRLSPYPCHLIPNRHLEVRQYLTSNCRVGGNRPEL